MQASRQRRFQLTSIDLSVTYKILPVPAAKEWRAVFLRQCRSSLTLTRVSRDDISGGVLAGAVCAASDGEEKKVVGVVVEKQCVSGRRYLFAPFAAAPAGHSADPGPTPPLTRGRSLGGQTGPPKAALGCPRRRNADVAAGRSLAAPAYAPLRISLRLTARLLRLPLKGGVIFQGCCKPDGRPRCAMTIRSLVQAATSLPP